MKIPVSSRVFRKESQQVVAADRHEHHNINPNRPALTRRQDISVGQQKDQSNMHYRHLAVLILASTGCLGQTKPETTEQQSGVLREVIALPISRLGSTNTEKQIAALEQRLSKQHPQSLAEINSLLPEGFTLCPVRHASSYSRDVSGKLVLSTETTYVCRLSESRDIVVMDDDNTSNRVAVVRKWFIRDVSKLNRSDSQAKP